MAYIKTDWADGDVISEAGLDHLENGVYNNSVAIGDLTDLDTTDKTNLVAAINEAAQSGGGGGSLSNAVKDALLQIAAKVAYIDADGQDYYDDLYDALYPGATIVSINADYTQTGTVYPTASLDDLRNDLVVNAIYDNGSVVPVISYTLSGTLEEGTSTITVTYEGLTDTFDVEVTAAPTLSSISAVYTQSGTVYDTDSLDSLKADLVVTATYSDSSTATVPSADYTLSGTLTVGTSTITVSYEGKTTTFSVTVSSLLPSEYQAVEYIQSTGSERIDTGISGDVETDVEITVTRITGVSTTARLFGDRQAATSRAVFIGTLNSGIYVGFGGADTNSSASGQNTWDLSNPQTIRINKSGYMIGETSKSYNQGSVGTSFTTPNTLTIFNARQGSSWGTGISAKLYDIVIKKSGVDVFKGIPCYRKADDVVGLYDTVSETFFTNSSGSGALVAGGDI